jgi:hypothetical protein
VVYVFKKMDFLNVFNEITTFVILVENEKVVAIIDFNFFTSEYVFLQKPLFM